MTIRCVVVIILTDKDGWFVVYLCVFTWVCWCDLEPAGLPGRDECGSDETPLPAAQLPRVQQHQRPVTHTGRSDETPLPAAQLPRIQQHQRPVTHTGRSDETPLPVAQLPVIQQHQRPVTHTGRSDETPLPTAQLPVLKLLDSVDFDTKTNHTGQNFLLLSFKVNISRERWDWSVDELGWLLGY